MSGSSNDGSKQVIVGCSHNLMHKMIREQIEILHERIVHLENLVTNNDEEVRRGRGHDERPK